MKFPSRQTNRPRLMISTSSYSGQERHMKPGKSLLLIFAAAILIMAMAASCQAWTVTAVRSPDKSGDNGNKLNIIATLFPHYDFTRQIVGDRANVALLLPPGVESHSYEPTPADIIAVNQADLFIYTGAVMENWADDILKGVSKEINVLSLADRISPDATEYSDHHHDNGTGHDHDHDHDYDPHIWTNPKIAVKMVDEILSEVCKLDPDNSEYYTENANLYKEKLEELDNEFRDIVANGKRREIFMGDRFALIYFTEEYGIEYHAAYDSCSDEAEPSAAVIVDMIDQIRSKQIPVVYYAEQSDMKVARLLSEETGAEMLLLHSCHNVSKEDFENGATYLSIMSQNAENLRKGLN